MKQKEVKIGEIYIHKHRSVEIIEEIERMGFKRRHVYWNARNLATGRTVKIRSAAGLKPRRIIGEIMGRRYHRSPDPTPAPETNWGEMATKQATEDLIKWQHPVPTNPAEIYDEWAEIYKQDLAFREYVNERYKYETDPTAFKNLIKEKKGDITMAKKVTETPVTVTLETLYAEVIALRDLVTKLTTAPAAAPKPEKEAPAIITGGSSADIKTLLINLQAAKDAKDDSAARKIRKSLRKLGYKLSEQNGK